MEEGLYSNLGSKNISKTNKQRLSFMGSEKKYLSELKKKETGPVTEEELRDAYMNELKSLLDIKELGDLVKSLLHLEHQLEELSMDLDINGPFPNLKTLYQNLSPVLLRAYLEENRDLEKSWLEAIRVSIEEEIIGLHG